ncbi:MAG: anhydro-N-acetylmuramic acid kinase [Armatimonadetes bacterium]|nr:anhydro-N-acetylmuramic acid kinase [Armatimonadota bacterium]
MEINGQDTLKVIGLMPAASGAGVDAALVEIEGFGLDSRLRFLDYKYYPYHARIREVISQQSNSLVGNIDSISALSFVLGELFAAFAVDLAKQNGLSVSQIDLIGSHGQTIIHQTQQVEIGGMWAVSVLNIGEPAVIANRTGVTVVANFQAADMAAGGQGEPLMAYSDYILFHMANRGRAVQQIGDKGSITYLPGRTGLNDVIGFVTGPGSTLIDEVVYKATDGKLSYDAGGTLAANGKIDKVMLGRILDHPFLKKRPPKAASPGDFGREFAGVILKEFGSLPIEDLVATVTAFVARTIIHSYHKWLPKLPDELIVGGRGAENPTLMRMLAEGLRGVKVMTHEDFGINNKAKEALSVALLASEAIHLQPSNVPSATGAKHHVILGKIVPGHNMVRKVDN